MNKDYNQNNLLGGLSVAREAAQAQPDTLTDAINATKNPENGDKFVYQAMRSTVPLSSIYQNHYNKELDVIEMKSEEVVARQSHTIEFTPGNEIKVFEMFFTYRADDFDFGLEEEMKHARLLIKVMYQGDTEFTPIYPKSSTSSDEIRLKNMETNDSIDLSVDSSKYISSIQYQITGITMLGYKVGDIEYFQNSGANDQLNVGPGPGKKILGTKTYNNVTYFIVGNKDYLSSVKEFKNNVGLSPEDHWNNKSIATPAFQPEFVEDGSEDIERDQVSKSNSMVESELINFEYQKVYSKSTDSGKREDNSGIQPKTIVESIQAPGDYHFNITLSVKVDDMKLKSWQHIGVAGRLAVIRDKKKDLYETQEGYIDRNHKEYGNEEWNLGKRENNISSLSTNKSCVLRNLKRGDKVVLEVQGHMYGTSTKKVFSRRTRDLIIEAGVKCDTRYLIPSDMEKEDPAMELSNLISEVTPTPATTDLHYNGKIEFNVNMDPIDNNPIYKNSENRIPPDITRLYTDNLSTKLGNLTPHSLHIEWKKPEGGSIDSYDMEYFISDNPDYKLLAHDTWASLGSSSTNKVVISINSIKKHLDFRGGPDNYYLWFRVAPRSKDHILGNWIGGYYRVTIQKFPIPFGQSKYLFNGVVEESPISDDAVDPKKGSSNSGVKSPDEDRYEYALDYMSFQPVGPDGNAIIHGISPGTHTLYVKRRYSGKNFYTKKIVSVGVDKSFGELGMNLNIDMSGEKDLSNFNLHVLLNDPTNQKAAFNIYVSPYSELDITNLEGAELAGTAKHGKLSVIPVTQKMFKSGNLYVYATNENDRDEIYEDGLLYKSEKQIGDATKYYKRIVKGTLYIDQTIEKERYNLEIGTFPSPNYSHNKGKLLSAYQPLQNLDGGAFITDQIKLSGDAYFDIELQPVYDGSVNIIFTDGENTPRIVNSRFSVLKDNFFEVISRNSGKETNSYKTSDVESSTRLVQTENSIPEITVKAINNSGGNLEVGSYKLMFKLSTVDGNETDFIGETGMIPIFQGDTLGTIQGGPIGKRTTKSIDVLLKNVDAYFNHVSVYVDHVSGVNQRVRNIYKIDYQYLINQEDTTTRTSDVSISFTGFEPSHLVSEDMLDDVKFPLSSVKSITQVQNRLFVGNFMHEDIDYNKLFEVGRQVLVVPSLGKGRVQLTDMMESWPSGIEDKHLQQFSSNFFREKIDNFEIPDWNITPSSQFGDVLFKAMTQGHHNPLFVEKYSAYWPKETYVYNVSFISKDNHITRPVPVIGADYSDIEFTPRSNFNEDYIKERFEVVKNRVQQKSSPGWVSENELSFNNIGVCRFPGQTQPNHVYFPKFIFNPDKFNEVYPGFTTLFKGFFFTRERRKPDVIMQGFTGPVLSTLTDKTVFQDEDPKEYVPKIEESISEFRACVPALYGSLGILGFEYARSLSADDDGLNWGVEKEHHAGAFITNMASSDTKGTYTEKYDYSPYSYSSKTYRSWFKSNDLFANFAQAAADFNGNSYGLDPIAEIVPNACKTFEEKEEFAPYEKDVDQIKMQQSLYVLQALKPSKMIVIDSDVVKVTPDFRPYGTNTRSPGGFSSLIPFRSCGRIIDNGNQKIMTYLTGAFTEYVGLSSKNELMNGFYNIYPDSKGAMSGKALRLTYQSTGDAQHIAITDRYTFDKFNNYHGEVDVVATRGDCFVTTSVHNMMRSLPAVSGSPSSNSVVFNAEFDGSTEPNSYRGSGASASIMATHLSNYLSFARHTEVVDERESALYGSPRTFLPLAGSVTESLKVDQSAKLPETNAFNLGYSDNFQGKKYYSISGTSPYYSKKGANTIAFSGLMTRNSFYNSFRSFDLSIGKNYNTESGDIQKIVEFKGNLISVHSSGVSFIPINDRALMGGYDDSKIYAETKEVLADKPVPISSKVGSRWIRSIEKSDNFLYGIDVDKAKIWRTNGGPVEIISDNIVEPLLEEFLYEMRDKAEVPGKRYVATFYNPDKYELIFSIYNEDSSFPESRTMMAPDLYYFLNNLYNAGFDLSQSTTKAEELLKHWAKEGWYINSSISNLRLEDRVKNVDLYLKIKNNIVPELDSKVNNCLTLVYSEEDGTWVTRWSVAPEFMFSHHGTLYSIANENDTKTLDTSKLRFIQDIEVERVVTGSTNKNVPVLFTEEDTRRPIIWQHEGFNPAIPMYGSMYGKDPVFEVEVVVSKNPAVEKTFETTSIIGSHSVPSYILYTLSDENPILNKIMSISELAKKYTTWDEVEAAYFNDFVLADKETTNPAMYFKQKVRDRRFNPISRSNALFSRGKLEITMSKGVQPLFMSMDEWNRLKFRYFQDKFIRIRLRYESGEQVFIQAILTTFNQ